MEEGSSPPNSLDQSFKEVNSVRPDISTGIVPLRLLFDRSILTTSTPFVSSLYYF